MQMSREPDKRTGGRYFDLDVLCGVSTDGEAFQSFLGRYASYVFKRARDFNARFQASKSRLLILSVLFCLVELGSFWVLGMQVTLQENVLRIFQHLSLIISEVKSRKN